MNKHNSLAGLSPMDKLESKVLRATIRLETLASASIKALPHGMHPMAMVAYTEAKKVYENDLKEAREIRALIREIKYGVKS